jgi:peptide/nickel transport system substrate-binding protein
VDALLGDLDGTFSESEQENILAEVDGLLWQDAVGVPLYQFPAVVAYDQDKVTGIAPSVLAPAVFWNVWDWQPVAASASD